MIRLMIADDEEDVCRTMLESIDWSSHGIDVVGLAFDGQSALDQIVALKPDIVCIDIKMPIITGLEVIKEARRLGLNTIFIVLSGYDSFQYAQNAIKLQVDDYLLKPANLNEVLRSVQDSIRKIEHFKKVMPYSTDSLLFNLYNKFIYRKQSETANTLHYPTAQEKIVLKYLQTASLDETITALEIFGRQAAQINSTSANIIDCYLILYTELYRLTADRGLNYELAGFTESSSDKENAPIEMHRILENITIEIHNNLHGRRETNVAVRAAIQYIDEHFPEPLDLEGVARHVYLSPAYLSSLFTQTLNIGFVDYIHNVRIEKAKELMRIAPARNYDIAMAVGYNCEKYFSQVFKKIVGITPTQYKDSIRFQNGYSVSVSDAPP